MDSFVENLLENLKNKLTSTGRQEVFENNKELLSKHIEDRGKPEEFTKNEIINKILNLLEIDIGSERTFNTAIGQVRHVDYHFKKNETKFLLEAKPLNKDLYSESGGLKQIERIFLLAEAKENYDVGIATNGLEWIFLNSNGEVFNELDLKKDFFKIKKILAGNERIPENVEHEITEKFYKWYLAIFRGGTYTDEKGKIQKISEGDSISHNIRPIKVLIERERIAQTVMDRMIFIKFLESKKIIHESLLHKLGLLRDDDLNNRLRELFFDVFNTEKKNRVDVYEHFKKLPYLNGSLFIRTKEERNNPDYKISARILKKILDFLKNFKFTSEEGSKTTLNPEILGNIFEKIMTSEEKGDTGAFYTPKIISEYISKNAIHKAIINRAKSFLKKEKYQGWNRIRKIDNLLKIENIYLNDFFEDVLKKDFFILDNACGSGEFLLQASKLLEKIYNEFEKKLGHKIRRIGIRKTILKNNIYGTDINHNAVEIAKLRLWLWLVSSYDKENIEHLPNIEYNLKVGG